MKLLGLSFDYHDAAAALVIDGQVVSAMQEERLSRVKHDSRLPKLSIQHCLRVGGVKPADLDAVVYYEQPLVKFDRLVRHAWGRNPRWLHSTFQSWLDEGKFAVVSRIATALNIPESKIVSIDHHHAHAAAAFFSSPFEQAAIVTLDGVGEYETATISVGKGKSIRKLSAVRFPHSLGLLYSAFTAFLGFEVNEGEYKVMGMAGFGQPVYADKIRRLIKMQGHGFRVDESYFDFRTPEASFLRPEFHALFGEPRQPETPFSLSETELPAEQVAANQHYANIAASLQLVTEEIICAYVRQAVKLTGLRQVVMAGGVALNSLANARLVRECGVELYVQPAAGDAGSALGAALAYHCQQESTARSPKLSSCYLGGAYDDAVIQQALDQKGIDTFEQYADEPALLQATAKLLEQGQIIGWFQGRSEWGPRALGARSILSRPYPQATQRIINEKIKFREPFRPFAPAVLAERATEYFELPQPRELTQPETFMLSVVKVRAEQREAIPAVTHVDGTARLQLVWPEQGTRFRRLIENFAGLTGIPVVLNTSFNRRGEPIVETPSDALLTFLWSGLDALVIGNFIVRKPESA